MINCAFCTDTGTALDTIGMYTYIPCPFCHPQKFVLEMSRQYQSGRKRNRNWFKPLHNIYQEAGQVVPRELEYLTLDEETAAPNKEY